MRRPRVMAVLTAAMALPAAASIAAAAAAAVAAGAERAAGPGRASPGQEAYVLACGGCHGVEGVSNPRLVPELRGQVGYFLATRRGRDYLVRLPNVAFCAVSDAELADILNYTVFTIGAHGIPANAKPYTASEVGALRKSPLDEVSLVDYRNTLVEDLIAHHGAPSSLRAYGK
jgi:mono/diheme cytochrome c family protein